MGFLPAGSSEIVLSGDRRRALRDLRGLLLDRVAERVGHDASLFSKLVLGCMEKKFCNQIRILQQLSKSTKLSS